MKTLLANGGTVTSAQRVWLENARQLCLADLFTFTMPGGAIYRFTTANAPLIVDGNVYRSTGLSIVRGNSITCALGLDVQALELDVLPDRDSTDSQIIAFYEALDTGTLRGARVQWDQWLSADWKTPQVVLREFIGNVTDLEDDEVTKITVKSDIQLLNIQMPRNVWQPGCQHVVYDSGCGLDRGIFTTLGTVAADSTTQAVLCDITDQPDMYYQFGGMQFLSGALAGLQIGIKSSLSGLIVPIVPLAVAPAAGDLFNAWAGCDRTKATCDGAFRNLARFRGMPYVPTPETMF